jgi:hypothetical protein
VQLLLQAKPIASWQNACDCHVWGSRRSYPPLALAKHHQVGEYTATQPSL